MNRITKYLTFIFLAGCEMNTPPLPPIDRPSFSYDEVMKQQKELKAELEKVSWKS